MIINTIKFTIALFIDNLTAGQAGIYSKFMEPELTTKVHTG